MGSIDAAVGERLGRLHPPVVGPALALFAALLRPAVGAVVLRGDVAFPPVARRGVGRAMANVPLGLPGCCMGMRRR